jgi:hypothetical protein
MFNAEINRAEHNGYRAALEKITRRTFSDSEIEQLMRDPQSRQRLKEEIEKERQQSLSTDSSGVAGHTFQNTSNDLTKSLPVKGEKVLFQLVPAHSSKKFTIPAQNS